MKRLGNIPTAVATAWSAASKAGSSALRRPGMRRNAHGHERTGHGFGHTVVDDYRRVA